ncbi:MAG: hypothetical protein H6933_10955 [Burkholderiaceae bacterium]|nr:hypothetical protein [Burkholderiaceae bacterium]
MQLLCHAPRLAAQAQENLGQLFGQRLLGWLPSQGQPYEMVQTWVTQHAPAAKLLMLDSDRRAYPREAEWDLLICEPHLGVSDPDILGAIEAWLLWSGWSPPA